MQTLTLNPNVKIKPILNGLGCPQCSAPLVDTFTGVVRNDRVTKDTHCTACDYISTYNTETLLLAKTY